MKTYDVFLCHSNRHDADTATENTMAMVYVLLKDQFGSRPRGQALLNFADELRRRVPAGK